MKKRFLIFLVAVLCLSLCSCGDKEPTGDGTGKLSGSNTSSKSASSDKTESKVKEASFPYKDADGRTRHQLIINDKYIDTENYPFSLPDLGAFYPMEDVLNYLGVSVVKTDDNTAIGTAINGNIIKVFAGEKTMVYGNKKISALNDSIVPVVVDNVLYVPSFFLMQLSDNSIVDYNSDKSAATLKTDVVINTSSSGPIGITKADLTPQSSKATVSSGAKRCSKCGGAGGSNVTYYENPPGNQGMRIAKSRWESCSRCGGDGVE